MQQFLLFLILLQGCFVWCAFGTFSPTFGPTMTPTESNTWSISGAPKAFWNDVASSANGEFLVGVTSGTTGTNGAIMISVNGGLSWSKASAAPSVPGWTLVGMSSTGQYIAVVEYYSSTYYSHDYGASFHKTAGLVNGMGDIASSASGQYWIAIVSGYQTGYVYSSSNFAANFTKIYVPYGRYWTSVAISSSGEISYVLGSQIQGSNGQSQNAALLCKSTNYSTANSFHTLPTLPESSLYYTSVACDGSGMYVVTTVSGYGIYYSIDGGSSFTLSNAVQCIWYRSALSLSGQYGAAIGSNQIYLTYDFGATWYLSNAGTYSFSSIALNGSSTQVVAAINNGSILLGQTALLSPTSAPVTVPTQQTTQIPTTAPVQNPTTQWPVAVPTVATKMPSLTPTNPVLSTASPSIAPTVQNTWVTTNSPITSWTSIASDDSGSLVIAASTGATGSGIWMSVNYGEAWTQMTSAPGGINWYHLSLSSAGQKIVAAPNIGQIYYSLNQGMTWQSSTGASSSTVWTDLACSSSGEYCLISGTAVPTSYIYLSVNYGQSWTLTSASSPVYWSSVALSSFGSIAYAASGLQTEGGMVYISTDTASSWLLLANSPVADWVALNCDSTGTYVVGTVYSGGIYYSLNSGDSWTLSNAPTPVNWFGLTGDSSGQYLAAIIGCTTSCAGALYLSSDYGRTWTLSNSGTDSYSAIASNGDGSQLTATVYEGAIVMGTVSVSTSGGSNSNDEYSNVGGAGGLAGIILALLVVCFGIAAGVYYYYTVMNSSSAASGAASSATAGEKSVETASHGSTTNPMVKEARQVSNDVL